MTPEIITRVVDLVKAKGDRVVLADSATGKAVVIIGLDEYERMSLGSVHVPVQEVSAQQPPTQTTSIPATRPAFTYNPAPEPPAAPPIAAKPPVEPRVEAPARAPEITPKTVQAEPQKLAQSSDNPFRQKAQQMGVQTPPKSGAQPDLTQAELLDKINREIGDWKTAQERKRAQELTSVARSAPRIEPDTPVEEEERFYLEPIE